MRNGARLAQAHQSTAAASLAGMPLRRVAGLLWILGLPPLAAQVQVTYLANEGVVLSSPGGKVLIDALFRDSLADYPRHPAATQESLETGRAPFDGVVLALATHYHLDHWDAGAISRFLRSNPSALFASTPTATAMLPQELKGRVRALWPGSPDGLRLAATNLDVEAFPLRHGSTQNLGFRIAMGGRVVVHVGDADAGEAAFTGLLAQPRPDVALVPFWWLLDRTAREFIEKRWKPRAVAAIHFGAGDALKSAPVLRREARSAWLCVQPGDTRTF